MVAEPAPDSGGSPLALAPCSGRRGGCWVTKLPLLLLEWAQRQHEETVPLPPSVDHHLSLQSREPSSGPGSRFQKERGWLRSPKCWNTAPAPPKMSPKVVLERPGTTQALPLAPSHSASPPRTSRSR